MYEVRNPKEIEAHVQCAVWSVECAVTNVYKRAIIITITGYSISIELHTPAKPNENGFWILDTWYLILDT